MNQEQLKTYLELAKDAELEVLRQEKGIDNAKKAHIKKSVTLNKENLVKPELPTPEVVPNAIAPSKGNMIVGFIFTGGMAECTLVFALYAIAWDMSPALAVICGIAAIIGLIYALSAVGKYKEEKAGYAFELNQRDRKIEEAKERDKQAMLEYEKKLSTYNDAYAQRENIYKEECRIAEENYNNAGQQIDEMQKSLQTARDNLETIYSVNCIFPKYRNVIAICTMYEYFLTGRVSRLEGPDGAYNLYESELRQNMIINKLDTVISQLEDIKNNQYTLYEGLVKMQESVNYLGQKVTSICQNTRSIAMNTELIAYCAEITAANSEISARCDFLQTI